MLNAYSYLWARQSTHTRASHWLTDPRLVVGSVSLWAWLGREEDCRALSYMNFEFGALVYRELSSYHCFVFPQITQINAEIITPAACFDNKSAKITEICGKYSIMNFVPGVLE